MPEQVAFLIKLLFINFYFKQKTKGKVDQIYLNWWPVHVRHEEVG